MRNQRYSLRHSWKNRFQQYYKTDLMTSSFQWDYLHKKKHFLMKTYTFKDLCSSSIEEIDESHTEEGIRQEVQKLFTVWEPTEPLTCNKDDCSFYLHCSCLSYKQTALGMTCLITIISEFYPKYSLNTTHEAEIKLNSVSVIVKSSWMWRKHWTKWPYRAEHIPLKWRLGQETG